MGEYDVAAIVSILSNQTINNSSINQYDLDIGNKYNGSIPIRKIQFYCSYYTNVSFPNGSYYTVESRDQLDTIQSLCESTAIIKDVFFWLAIALGIPGNLAAFITLITMPHTTCTFYIALLSIFDLQAILIKMIMRILSSYQVDVGDIGCKFLMMTSNFLVTYANWVLVLICVERFVTIRFPLKKPIYFTVKRARYSAIALGACLFPFFVVLVFLYENGSPRLCKVNKDRRYLFRVWNNVVTSLYSFIPSALLFIHVALITMALKQHRKRRESITANCHEQISLRGCPVSTRPNYTHFSVIQQRQNLERLERSITGMLLAAAIVFLVLTLPICVVIVAFDAYKAGATSKAFAGWLLAITVSRACTLMSHALNCYIYFLTCKKFRRHLFGGVTKMFVKIPKVRKQSTSTTSRIQVTDFPALSNIHHQL